MLWAEELRTLGEAVSTLGPGPWVVFGTPSPTEALFYLDGATAIATPPSASDLARARERGLRVAVYGPTDTSDETIVRLPLDPRVQDARAILAWLPENEYDEILLYNAREPVQLEEYLERFVPVDVYAGLPSGGAQAGKPRAILVRPGADDPPTPADVLRVPSERYARP